jgi:chromosome segregation protein
VFLKRLTIKGFKSFADTTVLDLEPGITVVVGPNGSGKSNIVDAVAWVLGAQAASSLRSSRMDDVIFAGTSSRAALGRAEVELTIDNAAGLLPIEFTEVTIRRTLFRSGDSEYAINGVPCRLLDVQELLSDSGVGRQQHVIVSQGQLDAVLQARPEDRRAIIEEAAGVRKFRRRKERAERRLEATEGNLLRLQDLLREVRRQVRPLERQAQAARRHGELVEELATLRRIVAGRELIALRRRLAAAEAGRERTAADEADRRAELARAEAGVAAVEAAVAALGGDGLADAVGRAERLRERARGLGDLLAERRRGVERERGAAVDATVVASLEAEAHRLAEERAAADAAAEALLPEAERLAAAEADLEARRREVAERWPARPGPAVDRAPALRAELAAARSAAERAGAERSRLAARLTAVGDRAARVAAERAALDAARDEAVAAGPALEAAATTAEARVAGAEAALAAAEERRRAADADRHAGRARADALALALDEARARAGAERLAGLDGVVGTLLDLVDVDAGWEAAFEAAAGEALAAVVLDGGAEAAATALDRLREGGAGAVLALGVARPPATGPDLGAAAGAGEPVRRHVRPRQPAVGPLLDALLAPAVAVEGGWRAAADLAAAAPGAVVVTFEGDRFSAAGWRVGTAGAGATGAALDEARRHADAAEVAAEAAATPVAAARDDLVAARRQLADAVRARDAGAAARRDAERALARLEASSRDGEAEVDALRAQSAELETRVAADAERVAILEAQLPEAEAADQAARRQAGERRAARDDLDRRAAAVAALRSDLGVRAAGSEERRAWLRDRAAEVEARLRRHAEARVEAEARREALDRRALALDRLAGVVDAQRTVIEEELGRLREARRRHAEAVAAATGELDVARAARQGAADRLAALLDGARAAELQAAELAVRLDHAEEVCRRDLGCEPAEAEAAAVIEAGRATAGGAGDGAGDEPVPAGTVPGPAGPDDAEAPDETAATGPDREAAAARPGTPAARLRELERELRQLGPVNPLALEELTALNERHDFLQEQLDDVKRARRELARVIVAVDEEIVRLFTSAYADVAENFATLFGTLFPGGSGRLTLTDPSAPLTTGVEVDARPPGKNVRKLSLLSGGERSLTALAFLFAVFRSRPSPFYLMDEVEAALDEVNLHRFLDLLGEFRREAQLVVVSHQKRTMEVADCLYGVTLQAGGSSKVVSERVGARA